MTDDDTSLLLSRYGDRMNDAEYSTFCQAISLVQEWKETREIVFTYLTENLNNAKMSSQYDTICSHESLW